MFLGILANAGWSVTRRYLLRESKVNELELITFQYGIGFFFLLTALFWWPKLGTVESNPAVFWPAVIGVILTSGFINYANTRASGLAEASLVAPIHSLTPVILALTALIFLGEVPSTQGWIGIFLVTIGLYIHQSREKAVHDTDRSAVRWTVTAALMGVLGLIGSALVVRNGSVIVGFAAVAGTSALIFGLLNYRKERNGSWLRVRWGNSRYWLLFYGALFAVQLMLLNTSFRFSSVVNIGTLKRFNLIVIMLLSHYFLGEKRALPRLWPTLLIVTGTIILGLDSAGGHLVDFIEKLIQ